MRLATTSPGESSPAKSAAKTSTFRNARAAVGDPRLHEVGPLVDLDPVNGKTVGDLVRPAREAEAVRNRRPAPEIAMISATRLMTHHRTRPP